MDLQVFDPTKFAYLNIQRVEQQYGSKGELVLKESPTAAKAEENNHPTFILFAELPLELQRRVWYFAALPPRIIEIHEVRFYAWIVPASSSVTRKLIVPQRSEIAHFRSKTDDPPLLRTCLESQHAAMRTYKRVDLASEYFADSVYFEFQCDTMYLSSNTMEILRSGWTNTRQQNTRHPRNPSRYGRTVNRNLRSLAFDAGVLLHTPMHATQGNSWIVPDPILCRKLAIFLLDFEALEEVILVLNENHMNTSDGKLSAICFYEPKFGSEVARSLQEIANSLSKELHGCSDERDSQAAHVAQNIQRNFGGTAFPIKRPEKRKVPEVRTMVTKLMPTSSR